MRRDAFSEIRVWQGPEPVRGSAHRYKYALASIVALIQAGVVNRTAHGVIFPYDAVHMDFTLTKAA